VKSVRVVVRSLEHRVLLWEPAAGKERGDVVLLHGYMDAGATFDLVATRLTAAGYRCFAPDMRGYGEGARIPDGTYYHFPDYILDLHGILSALELEAPLILIGHSMGGTIATLFAGAFPERVSTLALLEGVGPPDHGPETAPDRMRQWITGVNDVAKKPARTFAAEEALSRLALAHPGVDLAVLATRVAHLTKPQPDGSVSWAYDPLHRTLSPTPFSARTLVAFARQVTAPVLFIGGGAEGYHPPDEAERLAAFPTLERVDLPGAGHMLHWTQPAELAQVLLEWLSR
jgi:pimeloyl-ACP methyl ester carboxylesterase